VPLTNARDPSTSAPDVSRKDAKTQRLEKSPLGAFAALRELFWSGPRLDPSSNRRGLNLLLLWLALPTAALAHDSRVTRSIAIEPAGDHLQILISLRVPSGKQKIAAIVSAQLTHDGKLDPAERQALEAQLARRAIVGLALTVGSATVALAGAELKLRVPDEDDRPIDLVILGRAPLGSGRLALANVAGDPVDLRVLAGSRPVSTTSRGKVVHGGLTTVLGVPDRVAWTLSD